jgi:hypothetical protein
MALIGPSPKEFEDAVSKRLAEADIGAHIDSRGTCYYTENGVTYCPDIVGEYNGHKFVVDCKLYGEATYLDTKNCNKLERDKNESKAKVGIIVLSGGLVSDETREKLEKANGVFLIEVEYGKPYWRKTLKEKFVKCFPEQINGGFLEKYCTLF